MTNPQPFIQETSGSRLVSMTRRMETATWKVHHSFNTKRILIMLLDDDLEDVYPYDVSLDGENDVTAKMNGNSSGYMTVIKMTPILKGRTETVVNQTSYLFTHRLATNFLLCQCWDSNDSLVNPKDIIFTDEENATFEFESPFSGRINIVRPVPEQFSVTSPSATWLDRYNSNLYEQYIASQLGDGYRVFFPASISREDRSVLARLNSAQTGEMNSILHGYRT